MFHNEQLKYRVKSWVDFHLELSEEFGLNE